MAINLSNTSLNLFHSKITLLLIGVFYLLNINAQVNIKGKITDNSSGEELIGATIKIIDTKYGFITDFNGEFTIATNTKLPFNIEVSYVGYKTIELSIKDEKPLKIRLKSDDMQLEAVEVFGGISEKLKESPLSIESMSINGIKETSSTNFYEGLSHLKGVDLTSASLGFRVINTRGFNSTSPVRSLQIIDGVDNASPGLNFALGNFLGASELDLMKVEIVSGASSAFFGPNAFNGVISMYTKNPFLFPGFSASVKLGERNLNEYAIRYAKVFKNKKGEDKFAYKINLFYMSANDWEANNNNSVDGLDTDESNPGGYDAVNRYGDENLSILQNNALTDLNGNLAINDLWKRPGLGRWHRTGYWEKDLVDYDTENLKAAVAFHYLINKDLELISASNFGTGTTVYQGDNRFSLKNILFFQNKLELRKQDNFFIRAYATHEDAGDSYDAVLTATLMQNTACSDSRWAELYQRYWTNDITDRVRDLDDNVQWQPGVGVPVDYPAMDQVYLQYADSLTSWHEEAESEANAAWNGSGSHTLDYFEPGTPRFDSLLFDITSKASFIEGGSKIVDQSSLFHAHAEKIINSSFAKFTFGANGRLYRPKSEGSLFSDTNGTRLYNIEGGIYGGFEKKLLNDQLILKSSIRLDKNQNFDFLPSPAISFIYQPNENHTIRTTFTSAIRNPTLLNQYMYYNVGRAILIGNISGYDSLVSPESYLNYLTSGYNQENLIYFNLDRIRPEKVKCIELGYRGSLNNRIYIDANYYYNWYRDFIGYINCLDFWLDYSLPIYLQKPKDLQGYRIATNSREQITTQGFSLGINYYVGKYLELNGNYSWNKLNKQSNDPIIPAYNTPEHKFNLGITGRNISIINDKINNIGFNLNYKWIEGFIFEGSPQFTGLVPTYFLLDFQLNKYFPEQKLTIKSGASNLLNNKTLQVYGGPFVGRMIYLSLLFDWGNK